MPKQLLMAREEKPDGRPVAAELKKELIWCIEDLPVKFKRFVGRPKTPPTQGSVQLLDESIEALSVIKLLSIVDCQELIATAQQSYAWQDALVTNMDASFSLNTNMRVAQTLREAEDPQAFNRVRSVLTETLSPVLQYDLYLIQLNVVRYNIGGFYRAHTDASPELHPYRQFSCICYLRDKHHEGRTEFPLLNLSFRAKPGVAIMFPSRYVHRATEVTHGEKWILQFYLGDKSTPKELLRLT